MTREEKSRYIDDLAVEIQDSSVFYITDTSELPVDQINAIRRKCFNANIRLKVVKNALLQKAFDRVEGRDFKEFDSTLTGGTSIMFSEVGNAPAKLIKEFRKKGDKPILKGAYIDESIFIGDSELNSLAELKSKEELIAEIIGLLQSPIKNVVSGLKGSGDTITGILKTLENR